MDWEQRRAINRLSTQLVHNIYTSRRKYIVAVLQHTKKIQKRKGNDAGIRLPVFWASLTVRNKKKCPTRLVIEELPLPWAEYFPTYPCVMFSSFLYCFVFWYICTCNRTNRPCSHNILSPPRCLLLSLWGIFHVLSLNNVLLCYSVESVKQNPDNLNHNGKQNGWTFYDNVIVS